jgi:iron complex outermembrane receptor protein
VGAELRYSLASWSAGLNAHRFSKQSRVAGSELPTDGYTLLGADASWRVQLASDDRELLVYLRGENLLDEDARRHTSPLKEFAPLPGRSVGAGVRLEF